MVAALIRRSLSRRCRQPGYDMPGALTNREKLDTLADLINGLRANLSAPAIVACKDVGESTWTYEELSDSACRLAAGLRQRGVGRGDYIVLVGDNSPEWILCCLAVMAAGAAVVPIDARTDDKTLASILGNLKIRLFAASKRSRSHLQALVRVPPENFVVMDDPDDERYWKNMLAEPTTDRVPLAPDTVAAVFFTSGTTGNPKGVPLTHRNLTFQINTLATIPDLVHESDRLLLPLPLHHIYPFVIGMLLPLACGRPIVLPAALTGERLMQAIKTEKATVIIGVPRLYEALLDGIRARLAALGGTASIVRELARISIWCRRRLGIRVGRVLLGALHKEIGPDLRILTCGGASIDPELVYALEGFGWKIAIGYGLSETAALLTLLTPDRGRVDTVGPPLPGVELRIDQISPASKGSPAREVSPDSKVSPDSLAAAGEILARGPGVFSGYLPARGEVSTPGEPGREIFTEDGWFRTGDLGYLKNGYLKVAGRASCVIVTQTGKKIDPEKLEEVYSEDPFISEIGILSYKGKLVSVVVPDLKSIKEAGYRSIQAATHNAIDRQSICLPGYKRLSGFVVARTPLPRTSMGKIQRHHLATLFEQLKSGDSAKPAPAPRLPDNEDDRRLLALPAASKVYTYLGERYGTEALNLDAGAQLDLGIDSLEWLTLQLAIRDMTGIGLDETAVLKISTVRDLLRALEERDGEQNGTGSIHVFQDPEKLLSESLKYWLEPLSGPERVIQYALFTVIKLVAKAYLRLKVEGLSHIEPDRQYVFIPNHASYLDAFVLGAAIPESHLRKTHWAGWTGIAFANSLARFGSRMGQVIPIDSEHAPISSLALPAAALKREKSLVWFPEGRRTLTGELLEFRKGIGLLLSNCPVPVIPVYLKNTALALAPGHWLLKPVPVTVRFGAPQEIAELLEQGTGSTPEERIISALEKQVESLARD